VKGCRAPWARCRRHPCVDPAPPCPLVGPKLGRQSKQPRGMAIKKRATMKKSAAAARERVEPLAEATTGEEAGKIAKKGMASTPATACILQPRSPDGSAKAGQNNKGSGVEAVPRGSWKAYP